MSEAQTKECLGQKIRSAVGTLRKLSEHAKDKTHALTYKYRDLDLLISHIKGCSPLRISQLFTIYQGVHITYHIPCIDKKVSEI